VSAARVELRGLHKRFGGVHAVEDVDLELRAGEIVGLLGHNGAGKSTLIKLLSGALVRDAGDILIEGRSVELREPRDARELGIETIYQDLALADNLDATSNLFLGREIVTSWGLLDHPAMERAARGVIGRVNPEFDAFRTAVRHLSGGQRQAIAIGRAIHFGARVLIMDEPTAALGPQESALVAGWIRRLVDQGMAILLVSHDLHDVFELSDRLVVMKNGRIAGVARKSEVTREEILALMIAGSERAPTPQNT
jgi:D-xylose transport system ATP-binding protein